MIKEHKKEALKCFRLRQHENSSSRVSDLGRKRVRSPFPYELLIIIFKELLDPNDPYSSIFFHDLLHGVFSSSVLVSKFWRRDLLAAALVCKTWHIAAMDLLYTSPRARTVKAVIRLEKTLGRNPSLSSQVKGVTLVNRTVLPRSFWDRTKDVLVVNKNPKPKPIPAISRLPCHVHRILEICPYIVTLSVIGSGCNDEECQPFSDYFPVHIGLHRRLRVLVISNLHITSLTSIIPGVEFSGLEILQIDSSKIRTPPPTEDPPIQTRFPRLRALQITFSSFDYEGINGALDITSHAFPSLDTLELHFNHVDPRVERKCLRRLKKVYIISADHYALTSWWPNGHLGNIHDFTLPCHFFSKSGPGMHEELRLPRRLRILRLIGFLSKGHLRQSCKRLPTDPQELQAFKESTNWVIRHFNIFPPDMKTVELLFNLEKPQAEAEGLDAFRSTLTRFARVCKRYGITLRTYFHHVEPNADRQWQAPKGRWVLDEEISPLKNTS
ncbi:hypothetical protein NLI96_g5334 [Meripilus lineatus]|uniref:F-box domain-containing protein n=1 Tax=Meripilus lineatus TaxID=2056292 RepID=A0AAD5V4Y0_9APHY|nr:hypothetical protein NLI96_g5334 [Physisporinus lineatus]